MPDNLLLQTYALQPVNVLQLIFIAICLFGLALLHNKPRFIGIRWLLLLEACLMLFNLLEETGTWRQPFLITPAFSLCTGPIMYLLTAHLVYAKRTVRNADWMHLLPAIVVLLIGLSSQVVLILGALSVVIYFALTFRLLSRYHKACKAMQSDTHSTQLQWLTRLFIFFALLVATDTLRTNMQPYLDYELRNLWYLAHQLLAFLLISSLIIFALRQPKLFDLLDFYQQQLEPNQGANNQQYQAVFTHIDQQIQSNGWFQQPRLSLLQVAERLELDSKTVSAAINQSAQQNFSSYINQLRVLQVKKALDQQSPSANVLQLAFTAGFNSKSVFNKTFKQQFGLTPTAYLKQKTQQKRAES